MLRPSKADKGHRWWIAVTEFLVFVLAFFVAVACDVFFMSKTTDRRIVARGLTLLVSTPYRLARWIDHLGFSTVVCKTGFEPVLVYAAFQRGQQVDWCCIDLEDPFFIDGVRGR